MAIMQIKKYKYIKDEFGNKIQVQKTKEEYNKETKNGTCTWYFYTRYKINNQLKQYKSGVFALKRNAEEEERIFKANPLEYLKIRSKRAKINLATEFISNDKCLDDYYNDFFEYDCKLNKESTAYSHKKNYFKHISPILGKEIPSNIDMVKIHSFHEQIESKKLAHSTNVNIHSSLVTFLDFLILKGILTYNFAKIHGSFKKNNNEITVIKKIKYQTIEEYDFFIDNVKDIFWYAFFSFLFWHGLRKGEQQALRWKDINFNNKTVSIHSSISKSKYGGIKISTTKNKKNRIIYLADQSFNTLNKYFNFMKKLNGFNNNWFVFGRGEEVKDIIARNTIDRKILKLYDNLIKNNPNREIQILTHHEFGRHSHASYLLNKGLEQKINSEILYEMIGERLGDTAEVIKRTYAHPYETKYSKQTEELLKL